MKQPAITNCALHRAAWLAAIACCVVSRSRAQTTLVMRSNEQPPIGEVSDVSVAGVTIRAAPDDARKPTTTYVLGWDRVARVNGDLQARAEQFMPLAESAWRARVRLARGDLSGAEPLLEAIAARVEGQVGPTPALVSCGLLRCRIERLAQAAALRPWVAWLRSGEPERVFTPDAVQGGALLIDAPTRLAIDLPPLWLSGPALRPALQWSWPEPAADAPEAERSAWALADLYRVSVLRALGESAPLPARSVVDAAQALVWDLVAATDSDAAVRASARAALEQRVAESQTPAWMEAWCRVALGRSMLQEPDPQTQLLGCAQLVHVPARLADEQPYLAGLALAEAAAAADRRGDAPGAENLRTYFAERFPEHPATGWRPIPTAARTEPNGSEH